MRARGLDPSSLSPEELEALRRASTAAAQVAGAALAQLTGLDLALSAPRVRCLALDEVPELLGGEEAAVVALHLKIHGDSRGNILIALAPQAAARLVSSVVPGQPVDVDALSEMQQSALLEMGNILAGAYLNSVGNLIRRSLLTSVPELAIDMAGAVADYLLIEVSQGEDTALVIETELTSAGRQAAGLAGHILLLPDPSALPAVLKALRELPDPQEA